MRPKLVLTPIQVSQLFQLKRGEGRLWCTRKTEDCPDQVMNRLKAVYRGWGIACAGTILNQIYEEDFLGFSYGFRPGRSQRQALDALSEVLLKKKVNLGAASAPLRCGSEPQPCEAGRSFIMHRPLQPGFWA